MRGRRVRATVAVPLIIGLILAAVFAVTFFFASRVGGDVARRSADEVGQVTHSVASRAMFDHLYNLDVSGLGDELVALVGEENITYAAVRDASGNIVARQEDGRVPEPQFAREFSGQALALGSNQEHHLGSYELVSGPIGIGSEQIGTLEILFDREHGQALVGSMQRSLLLSLLPFFAATVFVVILSTRLATRPLEALSAAAKRIGAGKLDTDVPVAGMSETATLGRTMERMRSELQGLYADMEERIADRTQVLFRTNEKLEAENVERKRAEEALKQVNREHRLVLNAAGEGIYGLDLEGRVTFVNPAAAGMIQWQVEDLLGLSQHDVLHHSRADGTPYPKDECPIYAAFKDGEVHRIADEVFWRKDRTNFPVEYMSTPIRDDCGEITGAVVTFNDITVRKRMEETLRESEERARAIIETANDAFIAMDAGGVITAWNAQAETIFGWSRSEAVGRTLAGTIVPSRHRDAHKAGLERFMASGDGPIVNERLEITAVHRDGREFPVELAVWPVQTGEAYSFNAFIHDISEREQTQKELRLRGAALEAAANAIVITDRGGEIAWANSALSDLTGYAVEDVLGKNPRMFQSGAQDEAFYRDLWETITSGQVWKGEIINRRKDGSDYTEDMTITPVSNADGEIDHFIAIKEDISERKRMEEELRESESQLRGVVESAPMAIVAVDNDGRIMLASAETEVLFGYPPDELIGQPVEMLLPEALREGHVGHRAAYGSAPEVKAMGHGRDLYGRRKDGTEVPIEIGLSFANMMGGALSIAFIADITERKRMEEELRVQALHDSLTGVLNHGAIIDELRHALAAADGGAPCAVAMVDVVGLKATNDTYGHQIGDAVIIEVAQALSRRGAFVGRYGGDEFLVVLPSAGRDEADQYRDEVFAALAKATLTEPETGASVSVAASIGMAIYPEDGVTIDEIVDLSDNAMYASRRQRPAAHGELSPSRMLGGERAAAMVGQIVPLLTASGTIEDKLRLAAHRLSVGAGYDAVNVDVFAKASGMPSGRNTFSRVPDDVTEAWQAERRRMEDEPILQHVKFTRRALIVEDPQHERRLTEAQRAVMRAAELQAAVVVPLFWEDDMMGVLSVASKRKNAFTAEDIEFLTAVATQITSVLRMATLLDELQVTSGHVAQAREGAVVLLAAAAEAHDSTTGQHLRNVRGLTEALARELSYDEESARELGMAAVLHDIGKIRVQESILASTGKLSASEMESMRKHSAWGADFLSGHPGYELSATVARSHHERWDGGGYPDGLAGEAIPIAATIVAVADAFDAMTGDRPYRQARSAADALREVEAGSGTQFSPSVVQAFVRISKRGDLQPPAEDAAQASEAGGEQAA